MYPIIDFGDQHSCLIVNDKGESNGNGNLYCWGSNEYGELGLDLNPIMTGVWNKKTPQLVRELVYYEVKHVSGGKHHTCAIVGADNTLYCWGRNNKGQLGLGDTDDRYKPTLVESLKDKNAVQVFAYDDWTCVMLYHGEVLCWGDNDNNQVYYGGDSQVTEPTENKNVTEKVGKIEHGDGLVSTGKDKGDVQWDIDFSNIEVDVTYDNNKVNLAVKFGVARGKVDIVYFMVLQHNCYYYDQVSNDTIYEISKLYHDCNDDIGVVTLGVNTSNMVFGDDNVWNNDTTTLSFCLRADMIDLSTGYDGSIFFTESQISIKFDMKASFDTSRNSDGSSSILQIEGAHDATNDEETNELGEELTKLYDVTTCMCDESNHDCIDQSTELALRLGEPFYFCIDPIDNDVEVFDVTSIDVFQDNAVKDSPVKDGAIDVSTHTEVFYDSNGGARVKSSLAKIFFKNEMQTPITITGAAQVDVKESEKSRRTRDNDSTTLSRKLSASTVDLNSASNFEYTIAIVKEEYDPNSDNDDDDEVVMAGTVGDRWQDFDWENFKWEDFLADDNWIWIVIGACSFVLFFVLLIVFCKKSSKDKKGKK